MTTIMPTQPLRMAGETVEQARRRGVAHRKVAREARDAEIAVRRSGGETYRSIADDFGITHEGVRQICMRTGADLVGTIANARLQLERREQSQWDKLAKRAAKAIRDDLKCVLCGAWLLKSPQMKTCSPEHAADWYLIRYQVDPGVLERHKACPSMVKQVVDGSRMALTSMPRWVFSPVVREVLERWFPELLDERAGSQGNMIQVWR